MTNNLGPDDLFIVNRDGTTFNVPYSSVSEATKGEKGDTGDTGSTGPKGDPGTSVKIVGSVDNYGALAAITPQIQGDLWVVVDNSTGTPAEPDTSKHMPYSAYVTDGGSNNFNNWSWVGPLQGPIGSSGATGISIKSGTYDDDTGIVTIKYDDSSVAITETNDLRGATGATGASWTGATGVDVPYPIFGGSEPRPDGYAVTFEGEDADGNTFTFQTGDIRGATGPANGPKGDQGSTGATGETGPMPSDEEIINIINNITTPPAQPDGNILTGPYVHATGQPNYKEYVDGIKVFKDVINFNRSGGNIGSPNLIIGGEDASSNNTVKSWTESYNRDGKNHIALVFGTNGSRDRALTLGFAKDGPNPGSINLGLRKSDPIYTIHAKGVIATNSFRAYNGGNEGDRADYLNREIQAAGTFQITARGDIRMAPSNGNFAINNMAGGDPPNNVRCFDGGGFQKKRTVRSRANNITELNTERCKTVISLLNPISYDSVQGDWKVYGFFAEDVAAIDSTFAVVSYDEEDLTNGSPRSGAVKKPQDFNGDAILAALVKVVQDLSNRVAALEAT